MFDSESLRVCDCDPCRLAACLYSPAIVKFITVTAESIRVWDGITGRVLRSYDGRRVCDGADITTACLDDRGRKLVVGDSVGKIMVSQSNGVSFSLSF